MTDVLIGNASWMQERGLSRHDLELFEQNRLPGRQIYRTIKMNMTWALLYNVAGVSFALAGLLRPVIAAAAMAMSSLIIVLTSSLLPARKAGNGRVF